MSERIELHQPIKVEFQVHLKGIQTPAYERESKNRSVYIVGSHPRLGHWIPEKAVKMSRMVNHSFDGGMVWRVEVAFPEACRIQYRYFLGRLSEKQPDKLILDKWESFAVPRSISIKPSPVKPSKHSKPQISTVIQDTLGQCSNVTALDSAWLTTQMEIRLSFLKNPITWWKGRHEEQHYTIKITATDKEATVEPTIESSPSEDSLDDYATIHEENEGVLGPVTYTVLTEPPKDKEDKEKELEKRPQGFHKQGQFGVPLAANGNLIFKVQTENPKNLYFTVDYFILDHPKSLEYAPFYAGTSHVLYSSFTSEQGQISSPIFGKTSKPVGLITFNYLLIRPFQEATLDMSRSRFFHLSRGLGTADVGHRGMGSSYKYGPIPRPLIRENTLKAFTVAGECGADFVEFDVQLSKDNIPVVYHDFHVKVNLRKRVHHNWDDRKDGNFELCTLGVKDMTLAQLQSLQTYHSTVEEYGPRDWRTDTTSANADETEDLLPFPTLETVFKSIDYNLGFNVEIKYPQSHNNGDNTFEPEEEHFTERNSYLDAILKVIMENGGDRRIILSCFDADVCILLRKKQSQYPVLYLTQGQSRTSRPFKDFRALSIPAAIKFACSEHLMGICVKSEDLLRDGSLVAEVKHAGLILYCWGDDNANHENIQYLKSQGVDGIIVDRINEFINSNKLNATQNKSMSFGADDEKNRGSEKLKATSTTETQSGSQLKNQHRIKAF